MKRSASFLFLLVLVVIGAGAFVMGRDYERKHLALDQRSWADGVFWGWAASRALGDEGQSLGFVDLLVEARTQKNIAARDDRAGSLRDAHKTVMDQAAGLNLKP